MNNQNQPLNDVLNLLRDVSIQYFRKYNKPFKASGLKTAIQKRFIHFNERELGFNNFRDLLSYAASIDIISLSKDPNDYLISPIKLSTDGTDKADQTKEPSTPKQHNVRLILPDLFTAFMSSSCGINAIRIYHKERKKAYTIKDQHNPYESPELTAIRELWQSNRSAFVDINLINTSHKLLWAGSFLESYNGDDRDELIQSVNEERYGTYLNILKRRDDGWIAWQNYQTDQLINYIRDWARKQAVDLNEPIFKTISRDAYLFPKRKEISILMGQGAKLLSDIDVEYYREVATECISLMNEVELLSLRLPARCVIEIIKKHSSK